MYRKSLICVLLCCAALPCRAEVYRWVDEQGQTHFEDQPRDSRTRKITPLQAPAGAAGDHAQRMEKTRKLLNAYESERQQAREQDAERREQEEKRHRRCIRAKDDLRKAEESGSVYRLDRDGNRVYYSDAERESLIVKYRQAVAEWCS